MNEKHGLDLGEFFCVVCHEIDMNELLWFAFFESVLLTFKFHLGAIAGDEQVRITPSLKDQKGKLFLK